MRLSVQKEETSGTGILDPLHLHSMDGPFVPLCTGQSPVRFVHTVLSLGWAVQDVFWVSQGLWGERS